MQRAAWSIGLVLMSLGTSACMDQGARDRALVEMEAARWQSAHDARLQALEREHAFLMQQFANLVASTNAATLQSSGREDERDKRLSEISGQLVTITSMISTWREEERPKPVDPDARRIADQVTAEDRTATIRKVQALLDAGRIKLTMRNGRIEVAPVRPIDATNPYDPVPAKLAVPALPPPPPPPPPFPRWRSPPPAPGVVVSS